MAQDERISCISNFEDLDPENCFNRKIIPNCLENTNQNIGKLQADIFQD